MTSFPPNFIPIVDAFDQAVAELAPAADAVDKHLANLDELESDKLYRRNEEAQRKIERLVRDALADGLIVAWVKDGGQMEVLFDRESWRPMACGVPGFESRTHHLTNPGPNDERPVAVERKQFETWLRKTAGLGVSHRRGRPEAADWEAVKYLLHEKCEEQGGAPCRDNREGWRTLADAARFVHGILDQRGESAGDTVVKLRVKEMLRDYESNSGLVTN